MNSWTSFGVNLANSTSGPHLASELVCSSLCLLECRAWSSRVILFCSLLFFSCRWLMWWAPHSSLRRILLLGLLLYKTWSYSFGTACNGRSSWSRACIIFLRRHALTRRVDCSLLSCALFSLIRSSSFWTSLVSMNRRVFIVFSVLSWVTVF